MLHVIGAAVLLGAAAFGVSRALVGASARREELVRSAAGGLSVAFVMLDLFVELAQGSAGGLHEIVRAGPEPIHTIAVLLLVGVLGTFVAAAWVERRRGGHGAHLVEAIPHLGYSALVGATLVEEAHEGIAALAVFWIAMAIHLGVVDHGFLERFPGRHRARWTAASSGALVTGALLWTYASPPEGVFPLLLALVAGTTLLLAFRDELPEPKDARIGAVAAGAAAFALLQQLRWWL